MGKGGRGSSSRTTTASRPKTPTRTAPTQVQQKPQQPQQKPQQQQQQQQAPQASGGGMGMMGTIASVAAGSMIGNVMADKFMNSGSDGAAQQQPVAQQSIQEQPCFQFKSTFDTCLFQNQESIYQCQRNWDAYRSCMANPTAQQNWA